LAALLKIRNLIQALIGGLAYKQITASSAGGCRKKNPPTKAAVFCR
jgi:hypothetical protein